MVKWLSFKLNLLDQIHLNRKQFLRESVQPRVAIVTAAKVISFSMLFFPFNWCAYTRFKCSKTNINKNQHKHGFDYSYLIIQNFTNRDYFFQHSERYYKTFRCEFSKTFYSFRTSMAGLSRNFIDLSLRWRNCGKNSFPKVPKGKYSNIRSTKTLLK